MGLNVSKVASISSTGAPGIGHLPSLTASSWRAAHLHPHHLGPAGDREDRHAPECSGAAAGASASTGAASGLSQTFSRGAAPIEALRLRKLNQRRSKVTTD